MEPIQYLRLIKRKWRVVALLCVLGAGLGWITTPAKAEVKTIPTTYRAKHILITTGTTELSLSQVAYLAKVGSIPRAVAKELGVPEEQVGLVTASVAIAANEEIGTLELTAFDRDPERAVLIADTYAEVLMSERKRESDTARTANINAAAKAVDDLKGQIADIDRRIGGAAGAERDALEAQRENLNNELRGAFGALTAATQVPAGASGFKTLEPAGHATAVTEQQAALTLSPPTTSKKQKKNGVVAPSGSTAVTPSRPEDPDPVKRSGMGGAVGLILGVGLVLLVDRLDTRLRSKQDVEDAFGLPVIAEIPVLARKQRGEAEILSFTRPRSRFAESYRVLRTSLLFAKVLPLRAGHPLESGEGGHGVNGNGNGNGHATIDTAALVVEDPQVVLVTSPGPSEGKTTTVANLAAVFAEAGKSVLVVSADFRRPRIHEFFAVTEGPALASLEPSTISSRIVERLAVETSIPRVRLVNTVTRSSMIDNPARLLAAQRAAVEKARDLFDVILLDTAPLLTANDASDLLPVSDLVLMVCRSGKTPRESADRAGELMERLAAPVVGVALVGARDIPTARRYYYTGTETPSPQSDGDVLVSEELAESASAGHRGRSGHRTRGLPTDRL